MPTLHDAGFRDAVKARLRAVKTDSARQWGVMSVDQMMWHLCAAIEMCMGKLDMSGEKSPVPFPLPRALLRFFVLDMPWPKGAPTMKVAKASGRHDLEVERARCLNLIDEFAARPLNGPWPRHPVLGALTGEQYSRLQAKHLHHHLAQFGA